MRIVNRAEPYGDGHVQKVMYPPTPDAEEIFRGLNDEELHDPGVEYDSVPVELHRIYHKCPKCDGGYMQFTGLVFPTYPSQYEHRCDKCGYIDSYNREYPGYIATADE